MADALLTSLQRPSAAHSRPQPPSAAAHSAHARLSRAPCLTARAGACDGGGRAAGDRHLLASHRAAGGGR
eukprot:749827-Prymnesium_polylepis.1